MWKRSSVEATHERLGGGSISCFASEKESEISEWSGFKSHKLLQYFHLVALIKLLIYRSIRIHMTERYKHVYSRCLILTLIPCLNYIHAIISMVSLKGVVDYTSSCYLVFL